MPDCPSEFLELIRITDLAALGADPRPSRLPRVELESRLETWLGARVVAEEIRPALIAAALVWHDHLEEAHALAQEIPTTTGSFLHAIMHRREPDYNNARYWFHRVGRHESFYAIARAATPFLVKHGESKLATRLIPNGLWNPFAFVDVCSEVLHGDSASHDVKILCHVQRIEMESLVTDVLAPQTTSTSR